MAYRHRYHHRHCCTPRRGGAGKRLLTVLVIGGVVAAVVSLSRDRPDRSIAPRPGPAELSRMSPSKLQAYAADSGVVGGAMAAEAELVAELVRQVGPLDTDTQQTVPVNVPVPSNTGHPAVTEARSAAELTPGRSKPAIWKKVYSDKVHASRDMALVDALINAEIELHAAFQELDPPLETQLDWEKVKDHYLRKGSVRYIPATAEDQAQFEKAEVGANRVRAEIEVEVTEEQIRELRSEQRVGSAGAVAGVAFVLVLALFGFLRLDAWTRGYLTGGLAIGMAAAAGGAVALMLLAR